MHLDRMAVAHRQHNTVADLLHAVEALIAKHMPESAAGEQTSETQPMAQLGADDEGITESEGESEKQEPEATNSQPEKFQPITSDECSGCVIDDSDGAREDNDVGAEEPKQEQEEENVPACPEGSECVKHEEEQQQSVVQSCEGQDECEKKPELVVAQTVPKLGGESHETNACGEKDECAQPEDKSVVQTTVLKSNQVGGEVSAASAASAASGASSAASSAASAASAASGEAGESASGEAGESASGEAGESASGSASSASQ